MYAVLALYTLIVLDQLIFKMLVLLWRLRVGCRSRLPRGLRRGSAAARLLGLWVRIPPGMWMSVSCESCVLSGRDLCDGLITRPEESYRMCCVVVCDLETSWTSRPWPTGGLLRQKTKKKEEKCCVIWPIGMTFHLRKRHTQREIYVLWMLILKICSALRFRLREPFPRDVLIHLDPILDQMSPWHPISIFGM